MGVFIHPLTDWGFKRIFGDKELLIDFLNSLLEGERVITDLSYLNTEAQPVESDGRKTVYDLYCETDTGEYIIVEMQNRRQTCFKDRALYYMAKSVVKQEIKGNWNFNLTAVYGVYFVNCTSLVSVTCNAITPPELSKFVFMGCNALQAIYVPGGSVDTYKSAAGWSDYAAKIHAKP